jgi:hypothetical protein
MIDTQKGIVQKLYTDFIYARMQSLNMPKLTRPQQKLVSKLIAKEFRFRKSALAKRRAGMKLSPREKLRARRTDPQLKRIGFELAREENPEIPEK